jgi:S-adenosylmethionine:tRNA ribosyltransferase-isomerase
MTEPSPGLRVSDFDYNLPPELIAQRPLAVRDRSRLLVLNHVTGAIEHVTMRDLPRYLRPGDLLVANNSRVIPARLHARRSETGGQVELLLLRRDDGGIWEALARPARRCHPGNRLLLVGRAGRSVEPARIEVVERGDEGIVRLRFLDGGDDRLDDFGSVPLPPYIHEQLDDPERYQTTYASVAGSAAAPTAGLHVTPALRQSLRERGVGWAEVTLHIGLDTFRPVTVDRVADHHIHREWCSVPDDVARQIASTRAAGGRVIALGTTAARTLETLGRIWTESAPQGFAGTTEVFITPGYSWRLVNGMITNFHLPRSTLLMMVSALAGRDRILAAYREAIERRYRFFSFGDAMLIV